MSAMFAGWMTLDVPLRRTGLVLAICRELALDLTLELGFVLEAMRLAFTRTTPSSCNSDQGSHFISPLYTDLLYAAHVQISMDGKGRALDNIFTEWLWRTIN